MGCLLTCVLGAANAKFKAVMCESVAADKFVMVGNKAALTTDNDSTALSLESADGKTILVLGVANNGKAIIQVTSPAGKKVTYFNP